LLLYSSTRRRLQNVIIYTLVHTVFIFACHTIITYIYIIYLIIYLISKKLRPGSILYRCMVYHDNNNNNFIIVFVLRAGGVRGKRFKDVPRRPERWKEYFILFPLFRLQNGDWPWIGFRLVCRLFWPETKGKINGYERKKTPSL